jgi:hypothetical protein
MAAFRLEQQSRVIAMESICLAEPKVFIVWLSLKRLAGLRVILTVASPDI